jgi:transposase
MPKRREYPTDLSDKEWEVLEPLVPAVKSGGHPAVHSRREIMNAILYVLRTGCQWRNLPHDFPAWGTTYTYYRRWRMEGTWQHIHDALHKQVRLKEGRHPQASAAILDSQTVKTTEKGGRAVTTRRRK